MKGWLIIFLTPLSIILLLVAVQLWQTRRAMEKFALQHGMSYVKSHIPFFGMGEIRGTVNGAVFFMGMMSRDYSPEKGERDLSYRKYMSMHIEINGMPRKLIIEERVSDSMSRVTEARRSQTVTPLIRTGNADFDSRCSVYGHEEDALPWLTVRRKDTIAAILSREHCAFAKGGLLFSMSKTRLTLEDLEEVFAHLTEAQQEFSNATNR